TGGIEVLGLGALTLDQLTTVANGGGSITVDSTGKLTLNQATVTGGTVTDRAEERLAGSGVIKSGTLGNTGQIKVSNLGNALSGETVTNTGGIEVLGLGALTLDQLTTVDNGGGSITVDSTGKLTLNQATVTGGTVTDNGEIDLTGSGVDALPIFGNTGQIKVSNLGNALSGETVTNTGGIEVLG